MANDSVMQQIYKYLVTEAGYNTAIACGILANIEAESGFRPNIDVKDSNGKYSYGLVQWNGDRRSNLFRYTNSTSPSVYQQMKFLEYELNTSEKKTKESLQGLPNTVEGARQAGYNWCVKFERPKNADAKGKERATRAVYYWGIFSSQAVGGDKKQNLGAIIIEKAKASVGKYYRVDTTIRLPEDTRKDYPDYASFIIDVYKQSGINLPNLSAKGLYDIYKNNSKSIDKNNISPGDLIFYSSDTSGIVNRIAIADGEGGRYEVDTTTCKVVRRENAGSLIAILRIISDTQTTRSNMEDPIEVVESEIAVTYPKDHAYDVMNSNLERVVNEGYDYGYLYAIDHDHGYSNHEFKFYIPEFSEQAGADWGSLDIRGRSVDVLYYNSTKSRSISITLDLYAGEGLYKKDTLDASISAMHKDAFFVKSLEYPDYSDVITRPPSRVHLILGPLIDFIGVVSDVSVEHKKPLDSKNRSMYIQLSFKVTQVARDPISWSDMYDGSYTLRSEKDIDTISVDGNEVTNVSNNTNAPVYSKDE